MFRTRDPQIACPLTETYQTLYNTVQINLIRKEVHHIMECPIKENTPASLKRNQQQSS